MIQQEDENLKKLKHVEIENSKLKTRIEMLTPKMKPFFRLNFVVDIMAIANVFSKIHCALWKVPTFNS
jgi:hypothetical protein